MPMGAGGPPPQPMSMAGGPPVGMASGGLLDASIPESMFSYAQGGIVSFDDGGDVPGPYPEPTQFNPSDYLPDVSGILAAGRAGAAQRNAEARAALVNQRAQALANKRIAQAQIAARAAAQAAPSQAAAAAPDYSGASTSTPFYQSPVGKALGATDPALMRQAVQNQQIDTDVGLHDFGRKALNLLNTPFGGTKTAAVSPDAQRAAAKERLGLNASDAKAAPGADTVAEAKPTAGSKSPVAKVDPSVYSGLVPPSGVGGAGGGKSKFSVSMKVRGGAPPATTPATQAVKAAADAATTDTSDKLSDAFDPDKGTFAKTSKLFDSMMKVDHTQSDKMMADLDKTGDKVKAQKQEDMWQTLAEIGFGIAGGTSTNALENIAKGTQAALPAMAQRTKDRRQDMKDAQKEMVALEGQRNAENMAVLNGKVAFGSAYIDAHWKDMTLKEQIAARNQMAGLQREKNQLDLQIATMHDATTLASARISASAAGAEKHQLEAEIARAIPAVAAEMGKPINDPTVAYEAQKRVLQLNHPGGAANVPIDIPGALHRPTGSGNAPNYSGVKVFDPSGKVISGG